jgi:malate dehydrogenase
VSSPKPLRIVHRMQEVAIIGAGELGGAVAHVLARRDFVRSIRLIDESGRVAAGKALDIAQAAPVEGFATQLAGSADNATAAGASVLVVADRVGAGEWQGEEALQLVRRLAQMAPGAVVLCAGASQREIVDRAIRELRLDRARLFGSAPEALAGGARALVALAVQGSPRDVALTVLGVPPGHTVIPWEEVTVAGLALTRLVDEPTRRRLASRVAALWPPGPYALASAATAVIEVLAGRSRRTLSCFVGPDTAAGTRVRTAALPVRLHASGISDVLLPALTVLEQTALENAMTL